MPDLKKTVVFYEGDDDKAVLERLGAAGILPPEWQIANRSKDQHPGKDGLIRQLVPVVNPVNGIGGHAVVLVDLDEMSSVERAQWFVKNLNQELQKAATGLKVQDGPNDGRVRSYKIAHGDKVGRVALVVVGHSDDEELKTVYKIDRYAMDDWVFRLALQQPVFEAVPDLKGVTHAIAKAKFLEVADLFRKNKLEVRKSKTYIQILRALAAIAPATATIVGRLVKYGVDTLGPDQFRRLLQPFLEDLEAAARVLVAE